MAQLFSRKAAFHAVPLFPRPFGILLYGKWYNTGLLGSLPRDVLPRFQKGLPLGWSRIKNDLNALRPKGSIIPSILLICFLIILGEILVFQSGFLNFKLERKVEEVG